MGEFVAGVRYRAWQPPPCLHPTIGVHAPLVFDIVDTWSGDPSAAARITWRIPAAATTIRFPVNAYEAESRRLARFFNVRPHAGADSGAAEKKRSARSIRSRWTFEGNRN